MSTERLVIQPPPELPREFVVEYLSACQRDLLRLKAALDEGNFRGAGSVGHQMKGTGKPYGFPVLTKMGASIESAAAHEDPTELTTQVVALETYLSQVEVA